MTTTIVRTALPVIVSLQTGRAASHLHQGHADDKPSLWTTAFFKTPVAGPVRVTRLGLAGDEQADGENHGGPDKAVLAYSADHYAGWRSHLDLPDMPYGGFGENLTVAGFDEQGVCVGDTWRTGDVVLQVTQPRQPCWKMSRRWQLDDLARQVIANGKSGWYLRVLVEGEIAAGASLELINRPHAEWTIARAGELMHHRKDGVAGAAELAALPELSAAWKEALAERIARRSL
jgi:MOSC domain-containing protein YiiM